jgi:hypothetical protein
MGAVCEGPQWANLSQAAAFCAGVCPLTVGSRVLLAKHPAIESAIVIGISGAPPPGLRGVTAARWAGLSRC